MSLPLLKEEAKTATGCLDWLQHCGAECCKFFTIDIPGINVKKLHRGYLLSLDATSVSPDTARYLRLHGVTINQGVMRIRLMNYKMNGTTLTVFRRCDNLTDDLRCAEHSNKPDICKSINLESLKKEGTEKFHLTPNCLYRYQLEEGL